MAFGEWISGDRKQVCAFAEAFFDEKNVIGGGIPCWIGYC